jgi:hypothetical protein
MSLPVSSWGLAIIVMVGVVLLLARRPNAEHVMVVARNLAGAALALAVAGLAGGLLLRLFGRDPSWWYRAASLLWLFGGWPVLAASIWYTWRAPPTPAHRLRRRVFFGLVGVVCFAILLLRLTFSGDGPASRLARAAATYTFDSVTPLFATDECLAEHRLEYLSRRKDPQLDAARLPGYVIEAELAARSKYLDPNVYGRALHGYRAKVRRGDLLEPETLEAAACHACPGVEQELRAWIADGGHSDGSRELAQTALSLTLYPPVTRKRRGGDSSSRMLRYPSSSP